jgi:hypothetical protein
MLTLPRATVTVKTMNSNAGKVLPWSLVAIIVGTICVATLPAWLLLGPDYARSAVAGVMVGFFGAVMGNRYFAIAASFATALATSISMASPEWVTLVLVIPAMAALLGWESGKVGSRCFVFALFAWIMLDAKVSPHGDGSLALVFFLAAGFGVLVALCSGKEAMRPPTPGGKFYGYGVTVSLVIGLILVWLVSKLFTDANAHWIVLMFAMRFFAAPGSHSDNALRYAVGTVLGATIAGAMLDLPVPVIALQVVGVGCTLMGLRMLPAETPLTAMFICAGVVFVIAPSVHAAVFRLEAAVIAVTLAVALNWLMDRIEERWRQRATG